MDAADPAEAWRSKKRCLSEGGSPAQTAHKGGRERQRIMGTDQDLGGKISEQEGVVLGVVDQHFQKAVGLGREGVIFAPDHIDLPHQGTVHI